VRGTSPALAELGDIPATRLVPGSRLDQNGRWKKTTSLARNARLAVVYIKQQLDTFVTCHQATIPRGYPLEERGCLDGFTTRISPGDVSKYIPLERR